MATSRRAPDSGRGSASGASRAGASGREEPRISLRFLTSAPNLARCPPPDQPEVAIAGRSNAGKSSVLNRITGNRQTARVSKTPGRTQLLNFFEVERHLSGAAGGRLVDLPGYGFAKAGKDAQARWQSSVNEYLTRRDSLVGVILVMDIRHPMQPFDQELCSWAAASQLPLLVLLNKADKLKYGAQQRVLADVRKALSGQPNTLVMTFSAHTGLNQGALLEVLELWLTGAEDTAAAVPVPETPADPDGAS
ncbi:MAG: ribosome biogenesis GTP-binding protein YihA/YsxC [Pseudomonadales bacterium]